MSISISMSLRMSLSLSMSLSMSLSSFGGGDIEQADAACYGTQEGQSPAMYMQATQQRGPDP